MPRVIWKENDSIEHQAFDNDHEAAAFALALARDDEILCCLNTSDGRLVRYAPTTGAAELIS